MFSEKLSNPHVVYIVSSRYTLLISDVGGKELAIKLEYGSINFKD